MLTSPHNPKLKLVRHLLSSGKARIQEQKVVLEGVRLIQDAFQQGIHPHIVLYKEEIPLLDELQGAGIECVQVEPSLFDDLSDTEHSQGIIAVFPLPRIALPQNASLIVALDQVADPGNVGTILRTAAAAGCDGVILLPGTVDAFNTKVVRAGMGAHFRLPVFPLNWKGFAERFGSEWTIVCADLHNAVPYHQVNWHTPTVLIVGSEAHGISDQAKQLAHQSVYIPMSAGVESLNASIAAAVILFEIRKQRL